MVRIIQWMQCSKSRSQWVTHGHWSKVAIQLTVVDLVVASSIGIGPVSTRACDAAVVRSHASTHASTHASKHTSTHASTHASIQERLHAIDEAYEPIPSPFRERSSCCSCARSMIAITTFARQGTHVIHIGSTFITRGNKFDPVALAWTY